MDYSGFTVLITGPTSGIGKALAFRFARDGARLILVSRDLSKLQHLKEELLKQFSIGIELLSFDLSRKGSAGDLLGVLKGKQWTVDVLVNNAGYGVYGKFLEENLEAQLGMIELHAVTPTVLSRGLLPGMLERKRGGILNVASTAAFQPVPIENVYAATKAYLVNFSEALHEEIQPSPVKVICVCPGPTQTDFFATDLMKNNLPPKLSRMSAESVAEEGYEAFEKGRVLCVTGLRNGILSYLARVAPRALVRKIAYAVVKKH